MTQPGVHTCASSSGEDAWKVGSALAPQGAWEPACGEGGRPPASAPWDVRSELFQMCSLGKALPSAGLAGTAVAA